MNEDGTFRFVDGVTGGGRTFVGLSSFLTGVKVSLCFLKKILEDISPYCGATDTPVLSVSPRGGPHMIGPVETCSFGDPLT